MTTDKAPSVGEFVLVPKVPTPEILAAIKESASEDDYIWTGEDEIPTSTPGDPADIYAAMLAASPSPGAVPQGDGADDDALEAIQAIAAQLGVTGGPRAIMAALASQAARMAELRGFALDVMEAWPDGAPDGGELQELAEKHGLLRAVEMPAPCGEDCGCTEFLGADDFPATCYRKTTLLTGQPESDAAIDALLHGAAK